MDYIIKDQIICFAYKILFILMCALHITAVWTRSKVSKQPLVFYIVTAGTKVSAPPNSYFFSFFYFKIPLTTKTANNTVSKFHGDQANRNDPIILTCIDFVFSSKAAAFEKIDFNPIPSVEKALF